MACTGKWSCVGLQGRLGMKKNEMLYSVYYLVFQVMFFVRY